MILHKNLHWGILGVSRFLNVKFLWAIGSLGPDLAFIRSLCVSRKIEVILLSQHLFKIWAAIFSM